MLPFFARSQRVACPHGDAMPQRTGAHLDARGLHAIRVPLQVAIQFAPLLKVFSGEETPPRHGRVKHGGGVAFAQEEAVALLPAGMLRIQLQFVEKARR